MSTGERIKRIRQSKGLTQDQLGEIVHIDGRQISRYENGKVKPTGRVLQRFAEALGVPLEALTPKMEDESQPPTFQDQDLYQQFLEVDQLDDEDRYVAKRLLQALVMKKQLGELLSTATRGRKVAS